MSGEGEKSSWLEPLPEEYATDGDMTGRRVLGAALTVVILAIFGGLVWYSYLDGHDNGPVPVVRADKSVVKVKPETPGGLNVPNQDKRVFDRVAAVALENSEKLAPSAELPVDLPVVSKTMETAEEKTDKPVTTAKSPEKMIRKAAATAPATSRKIGNFLVQLGAFRKMETAEQLWRKLEKNNSALLSGLGPDIVMIDLGKKGVLYRLRAGMIADKASADKICDVLKTPTQPCFAVAK